jgi:hypothetical protein
MEVIYKAVVGSRMHGLNTEASDYDYREVFKMDLNSILSPFQKPKEKKSIKDGDDVESFELRHFLKMLTVGNGTAYEILWSDQYEMDLDFKAFKDHKEWFINTEGIRNAHIGYADSQVVKYLNELLNNPTFLDEKENARFRLRKASVAGIRILHQALQLLKTGDFCPKVADYNKDLADQLMELKYTPDNKVNIAFVQDNVNIIEDLKFQVRKLHDEVPVVKPQFEKIERTLLAIYS